LKPEPQRRELRREKRPESARVGISLACCIKVLEKELPEILGDATH
jgi:hypothetical protein